MQCYLTLTGIGKSGSRRANKRSGACLVGPMPTTVRLIESHPTASSQRGCNRIRSLFPQPNRLNKHGRLIFPGFCADTQAPTDWCYGACCRLQPTGRLARGVIVRFLIRAEGQMVTEGHTVASEEGGERHTVRRRSRRLRLGSAPGPVLRAFWLMRAALPAAGFPHSGPVTPQ
jgi:hypothetical protein